MHTECVVPKIGEAQVPRLRKLNAAKLFG